MTQNILVVKIIDKMGKNKSYRKKTILDLLCINLLLIFIIILFIINTGCKDPNEFEPDVDSLVDPPGPVSLVYPPDDTGYVKTLINPTLDIDFLWNAILETEYYEFQMSRESTFIDTLTRVYKIPYNTLNISGISTGDHFWRVRASSPHWTWFTDWSEVRFFRVWFSGR